MKRNFKPYFSLEIVPFFAAFFIWIIYFLSYIKDYDYIYPTITDKNIIFSFTLPNILLPLLSISLAGILTIKRRYILAALFWIGSIPIFAFCFFRGLAEIWYMPAVCSYTDNVSHFGEYDSRPEKTLVSNPVICFPENIDPNAQDVMYRYYYEHASSESLFIAVSWKYENHDDFEAYLERIPLGKATVNSTNNSYQFSGSCYHNILYIEKEGNRLCFVISNNPDILSISFDEVFELNPSSFHNN